MHVTVLEKNAEPGGRCGRLVRDGHRFDTGPTLLVMPRVYEAEFAALGTSLRDRLALQRVDPTYGLVFDDGQRLTLTSDLARMREQLEAFEPGSFQGLLRYLEQGGRCYDLLMGSVVDRNFRRASEFFNLSMLRVLRRVKPLSHHYSDMAGYFRTPRLKSAFTFQDLYLGLSPFEAPAAFSFLPYTELVDGVWYPRGGMYAVVETLVDLARDAGVEFRYRSPVAQIDTDGHHARGVRLMDGTLLTADVVLANADLPYVYRDLLPPDGTAEALWRKDYSCSTISFFWGLDRTYEELGPHTLFLADEYRANFEAFSHGRAMPADPSLYIHAPARLDPMMAPPGQDTVIAIVPVGHLRDHDEQDWAALRDEAREHVLHRLRTLGIADLGAHIKFEAVCTPVWWASRFNLAKGATHGLSHRLTQLAYFRPPSRHRRYRNLYFVGASTHPGTGVPTAMISGRLVSERIQSELD